MYEAALVLLLIVYPLWGIVKLGGFLHLKGLSMHYIKSRGFIAASFMLFIAMAVFGIGADFAIHHNESMEETEERLLTCIYEDDMDGLKKEEKGEKEEQANK